VADAMTWSFANLRKFVSSQQLKSDMFVVYLLLGGRDASVGGIITPDGFHVFSIYDFMQLVISGKGPRKSRKYVLNLWNDICRQNSQFTEVKGTLDVAVPSTKMKKTPTAGMSVMGLQALLHVLGNQVSATLRPFVEATLANYMAGDRCMTIEVDLNATVHPQIPSFHPNFMPPNAIMIED